MKTFCNLIYTIFGGFISAAIHFILGIVFCATVVLLPLGRQYLKIAKLVIWPFGKTVTNDFDAHPIANICFIPLGGFLAFVNILVGAVLCVTIIGIPFGKQCFKVAKLRFAPFGSVVE